MAGPAFLAVGKGATHDHNSRVFLLMAMFYPRATELVLFCPSLDKHWELSFCRAGPPRGPVAVRCPWGSIRIDTQVRGCEASLFCLLIPPAATRGLGTHRLPVLPQALILDTVTSFQNNPLEAERKTESQEAGLAGPPSRQQLEMISKEQAPRSTSHTPISESPLVAQRWPMSVTTPGSRALGMTGHARAMLPLAPLQS